MLAQEMRDEHLLWDAMSIYCGKRVVGLGEKSGYEIEVWHGDKIRCCHSLFPFSNCFFLFFCSLSRCLM